KDPSVAITLKWAHPSSCSFQDAEMSVPLKQTCNLARLSFASASPYPTPALQAFTVTVDWSHPKTCTPPARQLRTCSVCPVGSVRLRSSSPRATERSSELT